MSRLLTTVNPCFPRSGHRFLRSICKAYFGKQMVFQSVHNAKHREIENANYLKDHDFGLQIGEPGRAITPDAQYLVQIRHPLESVQSYFEFRVRHGRTADSGETWAEFLPWALDYWKAFVTKWCLEAKELDGRRHIVRYGDLYADTIATVTPAITFLTGGHEKIDRDRLSWAVARHSEGFARYAEDQVKGNKTENKARDIRNFAYFEDSLYEIEESLYTDYLLPLGLARIAPQTVG